MNALHQLPPANIKMIQHYWCLYTTYECRLCNYKFQDQHHGVTRDEAVVVGYHYVCCAQLQMTASNEQVFKETLDKPVSKDYCYYHYHDYYHYYHYHHYYYYCYYYYYYYFCQY